MSLLLLLGAAGGAPPPGGSVIELGTIDSAENVPGPGFITTGIVELGPIASAENLPGPIVAEPLFVSVAPVANEPNVPGPVIILVDDYVDPYPDPSAPQPPADPTGPVPTPRTIVRIYDRNNAALKVTLSNRAPGAAFQDVIADTGAGTAVVMNDDPDLAAVAYADVVRFEVDGLFEFASIVERKTKRIVDQAEESSEATALAGRGLLAVLEAGIVYPFSLGGLFSERRVFSFAGPDFNDDSWGPVLATSIYTGPAGGISTDNPPTGWPDLEAKKIWVDYPPAFGFAPPGEVYVRKSFTLAAGGSFRLSWTGDDAHEMWLDGVLLGKNDKPFGFFDTSTATFRLGAGEHVLAMKGQNGVATDDGSGNVAWLLASLHELNFDGSIGAVVARTDGSWVGISGTPPGYSVGEVFRILVDEAKARGALTALELAFDDDVDSAGNAWPERPDFAFDVGRNLLLVARQMADEGYLERVRMTPVGLRLEAFVSAGQTRPATLHGPTNPEDPLTGNLAELTREGSI